MEEQLNEKVSIKQALGAFSPVERSVFICIILVAIFAISTIVYKINVNFMTVIPTTGGTLKEGLVGTPRYINPILAVTDADRDIIALTFRGLTKEDSKGEIVPDLAESYDISSDNLTYTFTLKKAYFQDGTQITADDVLFTIQSIQNPVLNSSKRIEWSGVNAKVIDSKTISFTLKQPYAPFIFSTNVGIIPKHIWQNISYDNWSYSENNTKNAIGSGWYKLTNISQTSDGIPQSYELSVYRKDSDNAPMIDTIKMQFYSSEEDLIKGYKNGEIDTLGGVDPKDADALSKNGVKILTSPLPRVFGLFFNPSQAKIFTDIKVRKAIGIAINKKAVVDNVLFGYGTTISSPIPDSINLSGSNNIKEDTYSDTAQAKTILEKDGWKLGDDGIYTKAISKKETLRLSFEIDTNDTLELKQSAENISKDLKKAGIEAIPKVYETGSLNQDIIRPRKFQSLLFGERISNQSDLFAFWDSSQRTAPGLNISGYANGTVDKLLEQGLGVLDTNKQNKIYQNVEKEIINDIPAVFIYTPSYIYAVRPEISKGINLGYIKHPEDRFLSENEWYLETDRVWNFFAKK